FLDPPLPQAPPHAARRRALWRVFRQEVGGADLPAAEEHDFVERLRSSVARMSASARNPGAALASPADPGVASLTRATAGTLWQSGHTLLRNVAAARRRLLPFVAQA